VQIGAASVARAAAAANASYLSTGIVLDPNTNGGCTKADKGYTIQFWYRPALAANFEYLFGDANWTGASGAFRCFQNGSAGAGELRIRGPLGQRITTGAPLTLGLNAKGWVHIALVQNGKTNILTWYINGAKNGFGPSVATGKGTNFTCMGYAGSASAGGTGNFDDFRVYNWARTGADIAADYAKAAAGPGPSGCTNVPDDGYYQCDMAVNAHIGNVGLQKEPHATFTRLFTVGDTIEFSATSPAKASFSALCLVNVFLGGPGSPRTDAYQLPPALPGGPYGTGLIPSLELGWASSTPPLIASLIWPGRITYGSGSSAKFSVVVPSGVGLVDGDRVDFQWVVGDGTYPPVGLGTTNRMLFEYVAAKGPEKVHVEARGVNVINDTGFWEVWNMGLLPIKQVCIDLSTITTATTWNPTGGLNTGGTLAAGTSFRHQTDVICDLTPKAQTPPVPRYTLTANNTNLCFTFACPPAPANGFQGPTNHFIFDADTIPAGAGSAYIGATVTVTFCSNRKVQGKLIADPKDPNAAVVDL
ncbi:MAG: LamG-like jellyroll fold domain-containing protein, partial [Planctomycetota bacterium]